MKKSPIMICAKGNDYEPLQYTDKKGDDNYDLYTITAESLPSNMRTLQPASEKHMDTYVTMMTNRNRLKYVILTIALFTLSVVLLAVSLVVGFKQASPNTSILESIKATHTQGNSTSITHIEIKQKDQHLEVYPEYVTRTPCISECWAYAAFRFNSVCDRGFCRCKGLNYDPVTCLPHLENCNILVNRSSVAVAKLRGRTQKVFTCQTPQKYESDVHVLSIFGNHRAVTTTVNVSGLAEKPKVLVLVSYHPITWDVRLRDTVKLQQIVLVSFNHLSKTNVLLSDMGNTNQPLIRRLFSLTGYGQDRFGGHTPELLKNIVGQFGAIASFTGASHADYWDVNFSATDSLVASST